MDEVSIGALYELNYLGTETEPCKSLKFLSDESIEAVILDSDGLYLRGLSLRTDNGNLYTFGKTKHASFPYPEDKELTTHQYDFYPQHDLIAFYGFTALDQVESTTEGTQTSVASVDTPAMDEEWKEPAPSEHIVSLGFLINECPVIELMTASEMEIDKLSRIRK